MGTILDRRHFLLQLSTALGIAALPTLASAQADGARLRVAGGWRMNERDYQIGALRVDWAQVSTRASARTAKRSGSCALSRACCSRWRHR